MPALPRAPLPRSAARSALSWRTVVVIAALLLRSPAAIDRQDRPGDGGCRAACEEQAQRGHFVDVHELLRWLRREQHVVHDLLFGDAARLRRVRDLPLDERRP